MKTLFIFQVQTDIFFFFKSFSVVMLIGFMASSLVGASYFQKHREKTTLKAPMFIHDAIELLISVPNFLAALSLISA